MRNRVMDAAGIVGYRQGSIDRRDHLWQTARLKTRWHQDEVTRRIGLMFQMKIKVIYGYPLMKAMKGDDISKYILIVAIGHKYDLQILVPLLRIEAAFTTTRSGRNSSKRAEACEPVVTVSMRYPFLRKPGIKTGLFARFASIHNIIAIDQPLI